MKEFIAKENSIKEKKLPIFVKIQEYKEVIDVAELIKRKLKEAKTILAAIEELREREESQLEEWHRILDDVEKKILDIDEMLLEPKEV